MEGDQQEPDQIGWRQRVGDAEQIAHGGGPEAHRVSRVHHDSDAGDPLSRRLPASKSLEQDEVAVPHQDAAEHQQDGADPAEGDPVSRQDREHEDDGEDRPDQDQHVEHGGQGPASDARDLEVEHYVLGGLDLEVLTIVGRRRRQDGGGHAAIVISFRP